MRHFHRFAPFALLALAALLPVAGCKSNSNAANNGQAAADNYDTGVLGCALNRPIPLHGDDAVHYGEMLRQGTV